MKTRFTCRRRRCLPPSSPFVVKGRKPSPGPNSPIETWPGPSPTNADNSLHEYKVPRSDHYRRGGVTVPRATRCNRRVAPGRLSPAAASGSDLSDPAADVWARSAASRARTCAHRRARRPRSARPDLLGTADPPPRPPHLWCSASRATAAGGLPPYYTKDHPRAGNRSAPRSGRTAAGHARHPTRPAGHRRVVTRCRLGSRLGWPGTVHAEKGAMSHYASRPLPLGCPGGRWRAGPRG